MTKQRAERPRVTPEIRACYTRLLEEARQLSIPKLRPGNAENIVQQLADWLGAPVPAVGTVMQHAEVWRKLFMEMGLADLIDGVPKSVLTVWLLLCWRYEDARYCERHAELQEWAADGLTIDMAKRKEGHEIADSTVLEIYRSAAD